LKLNQQQLNAVESSPGQNLLAALELAELGWHVFPLRPGTKVPLLPRAHDNGITCKGECGQDGHGAWDGTTDQERIINWWTRVPNAGIGANLGDDRVAFDIDLQHGGQILAAFPPTRTHLSGRGNGNRHLIYRVQPGTLAAEIKPKTAALGRGLDIKIGKGSYIVMPPTRHEATGLPYVVSPANHSIEHVLTDQEVQAIWAESGVPLTSTSVTRPKPTGRPQLLNSQGQPSKLNNGLTDLLLNPPQQGGRNDWITRVAGHYAKLYRNNRDLYQLHCQQANMLLTEPLGTWELEKTLDSIWRTEINNHQERAASIENGYLVGDKRSLQCQVVLKQNDELIPALADFADFDIEALGVAVDELGKRMFWVRLYWNGTAIDTTLNAELLGDDRATRKWLSMRGLSVDPPMNAIPRTPIGTRLLRYLNSQNPSQVHIVGTLGWHDELKGFVTHDGLISHTGYKCKEEAGVVANPQLVERDVAPFNYGFERSWNQAQSVLREVLTFQDETVAAVFGAWWAACLLKPQIQARTSLFPFFGVEAVSESGKTNGFFDLMVQLNGNHRGQIAPTRPVLRDYSSANKNGIVWADDLDSLEPYGELLRASTSNGTASKMDIDRNGIKNTQVVAPILISGEALGMNQQKALIDRCVVLNVPSPKGRKSTRGDWSQWEDVLDLQAEYPTDQNGLTVLAGWFVQKALENSSQVLEALKQAKRLGSGRHNDKMAVLRAGARLLDYFCGQEDAFEALGEHSRRVEGWIEAQESNGWLDRDNTLTTQILPWALRTWAFPNSPIAAPENGRFAGIGTPVFIRQLGSTEWDGNTPLDGNEQIEIWVSIPLLAQAWARDRNHKIEQRTETENALKQQADSLLMERGKSWKLTGSRSVAWYRKLPAIYAEAVMTRAQGVTE
jgi:hypothetical protein